MKTLITFIFLVVIESATFAFQEADTSKTKEETIENKIDEKTETTSKPQQKKKDVFIDKDGDGICDNRANGMSFEKFRKRHQYKKGIHNSGGQK